MKKHDTCPSLSEILAFANLPPDRCHDSPVARHLETCPRCHSLATAPLRPDPKIDQALDEAHRLLGTPRPATPEFGQIYQVGDGTMPHGLAVVTLDAAHAVDEGHPDVRVSPITIEPVDPSFLGPDDILATPEESPLGLPFVIEFWNDRPIEQDQLGVFVGRIHPALAERLRDALNGRISTTAARADSVNWRVAAYRQSRIRAAQALSHRVLSRVLGLDETVSEPVAPEYLLQLEEFAPAPLAARRDARKKAFKRVFDVLHKDLERNGSDLVDVQPYRGGFRLLAGQGRSPAALLLGLKNGDVRELPFTDGSLVVRLDDVKDWHDVRSLRIR
ncbi:MAG TPA: hypothetical protein PLY73_05160 [Candidatus Ozemobacteraceae bacterium]|nr:hypothetical protein [Candidatus Ozemobacteraceae bacterium]